MMKKTLLYRLEKNRNIDNRLSQIHGASAKKKK